MSLACVLVVALSSLSPLNCRADDEVTVEGYVRDFSDNPIKAVKVGLYTSGKKESFDSTRTDDNGYYKIKRAIGVSYDVLYTHTQYDISIISLLAEKRNQQISIKMYKRGAPRASSVYHGDLQSAERFLFLALALPRDDREKLITEYKESGAFELFREQKPEFVSDASAEIKDFLKKRRDAILYMQSQLGIK